MVTRTIVTNDGDHIVDHEDDDLTDSHGATSASHADDNSSDDTFTETDDYDVNDTVTLSVVIPVPEGTLRLGSTDIVVADGTFIEEDESIGEVNSGAASADHATNTNNQTDTSHATDEDEVT